MTKSRKLIIATLLLAGGYCVALFLGGLAEIVVPGANPQGGALDQRGLLSKLLDFVPQRTTTAATGQLVPESDFAVRGAASEILTPLRSNDQPTWLVTTSSTAEPTQPITQPRPVAAPMLTAGYPITPAAAGEIASTNSPSPPKARITNVVAAAQDADAREASSWDRWPRWDPNVMAPAVSAGVASATTQSSAATQLLAVPVAFNRDDGVRDDRVPVDGDASAANATGRTHVVVDGDSLAKLADRYLDDAELDDELYRLNRDVLSSPDLLPIGVELRIPDGRMAASIRTFASAHTIGATRPSVPAGMVPVDWSPKAFDSEPRAQLLRPIPAGRSD